jgi:hypothetical protein
MDGAPGDPALEPISEKLVSKLAFRWVNLCRYSEAAHLNFDWDDYLADLPDIRSLTTNALIAQLRWGCAMVTHLLPPVALTETIASPTYYVFICISHNHNSTTTTKRNNNNNNNNNNKKQQQQQQRQQQQQQQQPLILRRSAVLFVSLLCGALAAGSAAARPSSAVGLCTLNQVDP